jgi:hypothetical protein
MPRHWQDLTRQLLLTWLAERQQRRPATVHVPEYLWKAVVKTEWTS